MSQQLKAVLEHGVFRPLEPVRLQEHQKVTLVPETTEDGDDTTEEKPIWEVAEDLVRDIPEEVLGSAPTDGSPQHDYYLYAAPKRGECTSSSPIPVLDCPAQSQGQTHEISVRVSKGLTDCRTVTGEEVLTELLNYFGARGPYLRSAAAKLVERMQVDLSIRVRPQTLEGFLGGLRPYAGRPKKGYRLSDCISMEVMRGVGLSEVLTTDDHFTQEWFTCLLER